MAKMTKEDLFYSLIEQGLTVKQAISKTGYIPSQEEMAKLTPKPAPIVSNAPPTLLNPQTKPVVPTFEPLKVKPEVAPEPVKVQAPVPAPVDKFGRTEVEGVPTLLSPLSQNNSAKVPSIDSVLVDAGLPATSDPMSIYADEDKAEAQQLMDMITNIRRSTVREIADPRVIENLAEMESALNALKKPVMVPENPAGGSYSEHYEAMGEAMAGAGDTADPKVIKPVVQAELDNKVDKVKTLQYKMMGSETVSKEEKKDFKSILKDLAKNFGIPALEILQAGAFGYTGNPAELLYEKREGRESKEKEKEFMLQLDKDKQSYEDKVRKDERQFQIEEAQKERSSRAAEQTATRTFQQALSTEQINAEKALQDARLNAEKAGKVSSGLSIPSYVSGGY